ncbi:MAG: hypothetical protein VKP57_11830 [Candidatus Sericytochromatia bacterium]|nr:hypothetical protein [Candidatus Sericytochromatia bacterium]
MNEIRKPPTGSKALPPAARPDIDGAVKTLVEGGVLKSGSSSGFPGIKAPRPNLDELRFTLRDRNNDGVLTGNETKGIESKDANKDGKITREEFRAATCLEVADLVEVGRKLKFKALDGNKDGVLTGAETTGIKRFDKDGDGRITQQEYLKGLAAEDRDKKELAHDAEFRKLDINEDGVLTGTESRRAAAFDADKDGKVTREEYLKGRSDGINPPLSVLDFGSIKRPFPRPFDPGMIRPLPFNPAETIGADVLRKLFEKRTGTPKSE